MVSIYAIVQSQSSGDFVLGALTGIGTATLIRRSGDCQPIGEVYKCPYDGLWKSWAGYEIPAEFLGSHDRKVEAVAALNYADRDYRGVREFEGRVYL
jgi:hypothetical protein